jgi:hypothetical protein
MFFSAPLLSGESVHWVFKEGSTGALVTTQRLRWEFEVRFFLHLPEKDRRLDVKRRADIED